MIFLVVFTYKHKVDKANNQPTDLLFLCSPPFSLLVRSLLKALFPSHQKYFSINPLLSFSHVEILAHTLVFSHLDYCNSLFTRIVHSSSPVTAECSRNPANKNKLPVTCHTSSRVPSMASREIQNGV